MPSGNSGYGVVTVGTNGSVKFAGALEDGTKIAQGTTIAGDAQWPLFIALPKSDGYLAGEVTFESDPGVSDFAGTIAWFRTGNPVAQLDLIGSKYVPPAKGVRALDLVNGLNNVHVAASGGNIVTPLAQDVTLDMKNKFVITDASRKLKLTLTVKSGLVSGSFLDGTQTISLGGVLFQDQNFGSGFARGPTQSGLFEILPSP